MEEKEIDETAQGLYNISYSITKSGKTLVTVQGKTYKIPILLAKVLNKIENLRFDIELVDEKDIKKKKKLLDTLFAKITALILLNGWSFFPFVYSIKWRIIYNKMTSEEMNAIMETGLNNQYIAFFFKNCNIINSLLALKMNQIQIKKEDK